MRTIIQNALRRQFVFVQAHLLIFAIKLLLLIFILYPLLGSALEFFAHRPDAEALVLMNDATVWTEWMTSIEGRKEMFIWMGIRLAITALILLVVDAIVDSFFLKAWSGSGRPAALGRLMLVKIIWVLISIIPLIVVLWAWFASGVDGGWREPHYVLRVVMVILTLLIIRLSDLSKIHIVLHGESVGKALVYSFSKLFRNFSSVVIVMVVITALFLLLGGALDSLIAAGATSALAVLASLLILFLRQLLRYGTMDAYRQLAAQTDIE